MSTNNAGWKNFKQLKDIRAGLLNDDKFKKQDREVAVSHIEDAKKRRLTKAQQRNHDKEVMAKSLVNYPKNPMPRVGVWNAADHPVRSAPKSEAGKPKSRKHANLAPDITHAQARKAQRKAALRLEKELKQKARLEEKAKKQEAKAEAKRMKEAVRAEKKALQEQRKAEKARLAKLPTIKPTDEMLNNVMAVIKAQFKMTAKKEAIWMKFLKMYANLAPRQQANRWNLIELRFAVMQAYKIEVDAAVKSALENPVVQVQDTPVVKAVAPTKATKKVATKKATTKKVAKPAGKKKVSFK